MKEHKLHYLDGEEYTSALVMLRREYNDSISLVKWYIYKHVNTLKNDLINAQTALSLLNRISALLSSQYDS